MGVLLRRNNNVKKIMEKTKVTSEALRRMEMGETVTFDLPGADAINSGRSIACRLQHSLGCKFSTRSDYINNTLTITKNPRP